MKWFQEIYSTLSIIRFWLTSWIFMELHDRNTSWDRGQITVLLKFDLLVAFNTVDHHIPTNSINFPSLLANHDQPYVPYVLLYMPMFWYHLLFMCYKIKTIIFQENNYFILSMIWLNFLKCALFSMHPTCICRLMKNVFWTFQLYYSYDFLVWIGWHYIGKYALFIHIKVNRFSKNCKHR